MRVTIRCLAGMMAAAGLWALTSASGASLTWTGATSADWNTAGNWEDGAGNPGVPGAGDSVVINSGNVLLTHATPLLGSLTMGGGILTFSNWNARVSATNVALNAGLVTVACAFSNTTMSNRVVFLCANDFTLAAGAVIDVSELGYLTANGEGAGASSANRSGGAGHGGRGGISDNMVAPGKAYGSVSAPEAPGSGGGIDTPGQRGGTGGGAVRIDAGGTVTVNGTIDADGGNNIDSAGHPGGGSGGSVFLSCGTLAGDGLIRARGGKGKTGMGGNGAGGRIAATYSAVSGTPALRFETGPGKGGPSRVAGYWYLEAEWGTVYLSGTEFLTAAMTSPRFTECRVYFDGDTSWETDSLTVQGNAFVLASPGFDLTVANVLIVGLQGQVGVGEEGGTEVSEVTCGSLIVTNGGRFTVHPGSTNGIADGYGALVTVAGDVRIEAGSTLEPRAHPELGSPTLMRASNVVVEATGSLTSGYHGYARDKGPGKGYPGSNATGGGGGHGGSGGSGSLGAGGIAYGVAAAPRWPGSGGGSEAPEMGGHGGGVIWLICTNLTLNGAIAADGSPGAGCGGGAGGSIAIDCRQFAADGGSFSAAGGSCATSVDSGGGGGGRIALKYATLAGAPVVQFSASPGIGWRTAAIEDRLSFNYRGERGTLYLSDTNLLSNVLSGYRFTDVEINIEGLTEWRVPFLTVSNSSPVFGPGIDVTVDGDVLVTTKGLFGVRGNLSIIGGDLTITNGGDLVMYSAPTNGLATPHGALLAVDGDIRIAANSWLRPFCDPVDGGSVKIHAARDVRIAATGGINADSKGFGRGKGPGKGVTAVGGRSGGGGYGGVGGAGTSSAAGGSAYGFANAPGPGSGNGQLTTGGSGGGFIWLVADGTVEMNGTLTADGGYYNSDDAGGGSGGGIIIAAPNLSVAAGSSVRARGGDGNVADGGGGGGGRIAIWRRVPAALQERLLAGDTDIGLNVATNGPIRGFLAEPVVSAGSGYRAGQPGTIRYLDGTPRGSLISIR